MSRKVLEGKKAPKMWCIRNTWMAPKHRAMVHQDERVPELKKYPCEQCDKVFNSSNRLKLHIEGKHLNIKRFGCEACGYRTNDRRTTVKNAKPSVVPSNECPYVNYPKPWSYN